MKKRRSTSVGEQGSCPSSEDTKPLRVQPLRGQRPDMRLTPRARPIHAEGTFEHTTRLDIYQEFAIFSRRMAAGEIVHWRGYIRRWEQ